MFEISAMRESILVCIDLASKMIPLIRNNNSDGNIKLGLDLWGKINKLLEVNNQALAAVEQLQLQGISLPAPNPFTENELSIDIKNDCAMLISKGMELKRLIDAPQLPPAPGGPRIKMN